MSAVGPELGKSTYGMRKMAPSPKQGGIYIYNNITKNKRISEWLEKRPNTFM
jgi:hypothetical protein